jgi:transposase-like protein
MGQVLHGSATTTHAIRAAIQRSKAPLKELAARYGLNRKTVAKWRKRSFLHDAPMGPKAPCSTVLAAEEAAAAIAFRKHTLLPLDDRLYALQAKKAFRRYPIGFFHIDIAEVRTEEGKLHLFVAVDRTSK